MVSNGNATSISDRRPEPRGKGTSGSNDGNHASAQVQGASLDGQEQPPAMKTEGSLDRGTNIRRLERTALMVSRAILRCHTEVPVLNDTCRMLVEEVGFTMAWIGQQDGKEIVPIAQAEVPPDYQPPQGPIASALDPVRASLQEDRPRVAQDLGKGSGGLHVHAAEHGYASQCAVPVALADGPGVLVVYSREPHAFQAEEVALLWEIAGDLDHGMRRLREMALREQQEQDLERAKAHYDTFYENAPVPLFMATPGGRITSANHAFARLLGRKSAQEVLEQKDVTLYTIMTPADKNRLFEQARAEQPAPVELAFFSNNNGITRASVSAQIVTTEDGPRLKIHAQPLGGGTDAKTGSGSAAPGAGPSDAPAFDDLVHQMNNALTPVLNHIELALSAAQTEKNKHLSEAQEAAGRLVRSLRAERGRVSPAQ